MPPITMLPIPVRSLAHSALTGVAANQHPGQSTRLTGTRLAAAASGNVTYGVTGFQPTALALVVAINTSSSTGFSVGFADDDDFEQMISVFDTSGTHSISRLAELIRIFDPSGIDGQTAVLFSLNANDVTLAWTKVGAGQNVSFAMLAIG